MTDRLLQPAETPVHAFNLAGLIDQARRRAATDPRHIAILAALKRLVPRRAFGPRFGNGKYKPILECNNYEE